MSDAPFELKGFEPISRLGGGGFGEVWLAKQVNIDRQVAIKIGHAPIDDKTVQLRFERECIALGRLSGHPNIIDVFTAGQLDDDRPYLVLEFVNGGTLWQRLQRGPLSESELCRVGIQLSDALTVAHGAGVLHRDLKPENVLLRQNGDAVLGDFGIARLHDGANTTSHAITASVAYAAPEILSGKSASVASDLYGIGICLLASVLRSVPFVHKTDESIHPIINRVLTDKPPELRQHGVSEQLSSAIGMLLEKDPDKRPRSATDTKALLERAASSASSSTPSGAGPTVIAPSPPPHATESGQRSGPPIAPSPGPSTGSQAAPAANPGPGARPAPRHAPPPPVAPPQQRPAPPHNAPAPTGFPAPPRPQSAPAGGSSGAESLPPPAFQPGNHPPPRQPPGVGPRTAPGGPQQVQAPADPPGAFAPHQPQQPQQFATAGRPPTFSPSGSGANSNDRVRVFALAFGATVVVGGLLLFVLSRLSGGSENSAPDITTVAEAPSDDESGASDGDSDTSDTSDTSDGGAPSTTDAATTTEAPTTPPPSTAPQPVALPLAIADTSLGSDATTTVDTEGPEAPQFCDNTPVTVGLGEWEAETYTHASGSPIVYQSIARFDSAAQAQAYLRSYVVNVNCDDWVLEGEAGDPDVLITPQVITPPRTSYGDDTRELEFEGTAEGVTIYGRTALVGLGTDVYQVSVTSLFRSDLDDLDSLLEVAVGRLQT